MHARISIRAQTSGLPACIVPFMGGIALVLALLGAGTPAAAGPNQAVADHEPSVRVHLARYEGRYRQDARFGRAFRRIDAEVARALDVIEDRLGITPKYQGRIHVHVRDADLKRFGTDRARCTTRRVGNEAHEHIDLFAEYFVSGDSDVRTVLTHELVHAVMRQRAGRSVYARLPHWVREGLAVHTADQGLRHLRRNLVAQEDVGALMTGLMTSERSIVMYPYAWLAVELLSRRGGPTAVERFTRGVVAGRDVKRLSGRIAGTTWKKFGTDLRSFARQRIEQEAAGLKDMKAARRLYRAKRWPEARKAFAAFAAAWPGSALGPTARYYAARCWFREGRYKEAAAGFHACIETDLGRSGWIDECHLFLGLARLEQERHGEASATLRDYVDFHPYAGQRDLGYLALGRSLTRQGRDDEARAAFRAVAAVGGARSSNKAAAVRELRALGES